MISDLWNIPAHKFLFKGSKVKKYVFLVYLLYIPNVDCQVI